MAETQKNVLLTPGRIQKFLQAAEFLNINNIIKILFCGVSGIICSQLIRRSHITMSNLGKFGPKYLTNAAKIKKICYTHRITHPTGASTKKKS